MPNVFMIMPFQEQFLKLYEVMKKKLKDEFSFYNAGDLDNQQNILQDIVEGIANADIVIADVTGLNPNVFYELGLCHALNKKVILITQNMSELPFDIRAYRANEYSTDFWKMDEFIEKIAGYIRGAIDGTIQYGNPIGDYYPNKICSAEEKKNVNNVEDEKGYFDFVSEIAEDTEVLTNEINTMQNELCTMTMEIEKGTDEINRVNKNQLPGRVFLIRNIIRNVGTEIKEFSDKMINHNNIIEKKWGNIENNYLNLIENKYINEEENREGLISSVKSLYSIKSGILSSNSKIEEMISSFSAVKGVEKNLTSATRALEEQLLNYLGIMNTAISSIDRIISKTENIVGQVYFRKIQN